MRSVFFFLVLHLFKVFRQSSYNMLISARPVRLVAIRAILDLAPHERPSATIGEKVKRTVTEQTIEILVVFSRMTRKVITIGISEKTKITTHGFYHAASFNISGASRGLMASEGLIVSIRIAPIIKIAVLK